MWNASWVWRCFSSRKSGNCQIETAPKEMHWTTFAFKVTSHVSEHILHFQQRLMQRYGLCFFISGVHGIFFERNGVFHLNRGSVYFYIDIQVAEYFKNLMVKICHRIAI